MNQPFIIFQQGETNQRIDLERARIEVNYGKWDQYLMNDICRKIKKWNVKQALFSGSNKVDPLPAIKNIPFPHLRFINIRNNEIQSIQCFSFLFMPELDDLYMSTYDGMKVQNRITCMKVFTKVFWPKLTKLAFQGNWSFQLSHLSKMYMRREMIEELHVDWKSHAEQSCDSRWILKLQTMKIITLYLESEKRIEKQVQKVRSVLHKKQHSS